ncbi:MAG: signal peptidase I [Myxococcales bacterium]|nr:signal peptidase I [Myxococcales bacterium]
MSDPVSDSEFDRGWFVERSPKPAIAFLLTLVCPGLGWAYLGQPLLGILVSMLFVIAAAAFVALWTALKFFPFLPMTVFVTGWLWFSFMMAGTVYEAAQREKGRQVGSKLARFAACVGVLVLAYAGPLLVLSNYTQTRLWSLMPLPNDNMYPNLRAGDVLLLDRTAYNRQRPEIGDIVAFTVMVGDQPAIGLGRVVSVGPSRVITEYSSFWVDGTRVPRSRVDESVGLGAELAEQIDTELTGLDRPLVYAEMNGDVVYYTSEQLSAVSLSEPSEEVLDEGEYFILNDNRSRVSDSRTVGPIRRNQILGRPVYIAFSRDEQGDMRWDRIARTIQPGAADMVVTTGDDLHSSTGSP